MRDELSIAELDSELATELPTRTLMSWRRSHSYGYKRMSYRHYNSCSCSCGGYGNYGYGRGYGGGYGGYGYGRGYGYGGGYGYGRGYGFGGFGGGVSNFNATRQSIFNPQTAIGFGGGGISQVGGNANFNNSTQFGFSGF